MSAHVRVTRRVSTAFRRPAVNWSIVIPWLISVACEGCGSCRCCDSGYSCVQSGRDGCHQPGDTTHTPLVFPWSAPDGDSCRRRVLHGIPSTKNRLFHDRSATAASRWRYGSHRRTLPAPLYAGHRLDGSRYSLREVMRNGPWCGSFHRWPMHEDHRVGSW